VRRPNPWVAVSLAIYSVAALVDNGLTYACIILGLGREFNPVAALLLQAHPLALFLKDALFLLAMIPLASACRILAYKTSPRDAPLRRLWWTPLMAAAVARLLPAVHNILIFCGYESPLTGAMKTFYEAIFRA